MSGSTTMVDYSSGGRLSTEDMSGQRCLSDDSLMELRSCGQFENGTPSTSPPYWDTDDDEDDCGPKPSALYGKFTWKIEKFSEITKRELRSNAFEVGGYKWYILIYPQGCDVCNHLSLFLCVANHDKLLPGWSHFAQFTIAVVNKDPKKSKYSDTLHRFWKKEHDWGWKKFIELSKVLEGFINDDSLVIKAQVQVIREKANRPFRCLDCQYRRELVRVYLSNVEQICRRFIEDRRGKFSKLIEDKVRWSSFRAFWLGIDQIARRRMSRDKTDAILKVVVKHFFVEKEVTSTLVMDSLYSGLKALECQSQNKKGKTKIIEVEELPASVIYIENDMFVLVDDVLLLLERVALGSVPLQPLTPKDEKGSQNRTKDGSSGEEFNKDSIERDERRLTEFGRRTLEFFVLAHIFSSRIEVAYQEAVALKRQEELIREEEAAEQAENELKAKRSAMDKEKRTKKKQGRESFAPPRRPRSYIRPNSEMYFTVEDAKQRRNSRKVKDRTRDEKSDLMMQDKHREQSPSDESLLEEFSSKQEGVAPENASDTSDTGDDVAETVQPDLEDRDCCHVNWDTDALEIHPTMESSNFVIQNGQTGKRTTSVVDDSSSTCSTDSISSVVINGSYKGYSMQNSKSLSPPNRGNNQQGKDTQHRSSDASYLSGATGRNPGPETKAVFSSNNRKQFPEQHHVDKEGVVQLQKGLNVKDQVDFEQSSNSRTSETPPALGASSKPPYVLLQQPKQSSENATDTTTSRTSTNRVEAITVKEANASSAAPSSISVRPVTRSLQVSSSKSETLKHPTPTKSTMAQQAASMSRPSSAPLIPAPRPTFPVVSPVQTALLMSRSVSAADRLGTDPSPSAPSFVPQSYRNAITGKNDVATIPSGFISPALTTTRKDEASVRPGLTFGSLKQAALQSQYQPRDESSHPEPSSSSRYYNSDLVSGIKRMDIHGELQARKQYSGGVSSSVMSFPPQVMASDEFPHLDIINDLLDEDKSIAKAATNFHYHHPHNQRHHHLFNRHYSLSDADVGSFSSPSHLDQTEHYYDDGGYQRIYGSSSSSHLHGLRDEQYSQVDLSTYANGQLQGVIQNQWPYSAPDLSMLSLGSAADAGGYSYQLPDYSNGVNGYMYTWPGNGL